MSQHTVAVVILNYNGKKFLERFLAGVIATSEGHHIAVADNASTDGSLEFLEQHFPGIQVISTGFNHGYALGYNIALKEVDAKYFVLLNNDVETPPGWLSPLVQLMESDHRIAACQPLMLDQSNKSMLEYAGAAGGYIDRLGYPFCNGRIFSTLEPAKSLIPQAREIFWASGACMFVRASAFTQAGGFDPDYFAHMEEIDLCWRFKNLGHSIFVHGGSQVFHVGGGTLNRISPRKTYLNFRNNLATLTKNSKGPSLFVKIPARLVLDGIAALKFLLEGQAAHFASVFRAHFAFYAAIPRIMRQRSTLRRSPDFRYRRSAMYKGNIVFQYYVLGRKKFSDLGNRFFTE